MRKIFLLLICFVAAIDLNAQSAEILTILKKDKLYSAQEMDNHIASLKPYVERRETNENEYASSIMKDANKLETQTIKGINNAKKLRVKLNEAGKNYWVNEIDDLIGYFITIKTKSALVQSNAHSLFYLNNKKETVIQYYNEMVSASSIILSNANYARNTYKTIEEIFRWELTYESKEDSDQRIQLELEKYRTSVINNYDEPETGCIEGDCENGYGVYVTEKGTRKEGLYKNKALEGAAKINYSSGINYIGETSKGYRHGLGIMQYDNGDIYFGSWNLGNKQGLGVLLKKDGTIEKGYYKDGTFVKNETQGSIAAIASIDISKKRCISGDCVNGYGTYVFDSGSVYFGSWKNKQIDGIGCYYFDTGSVYCGEFKDGKIDGFGGKMINPGSSFEAYIGDWKNNKSNGEGTYIYKDGTFKNGTWIDGESKSN